MRTTISLDPAVAALAEKIAAKENRSFSNLCEVALGEYCGPRQGPEHHAELIATAEEIGMPRALALLSEAKRPGRRKHAA